jgi:hypothetical protein
MFPALFKEQGAASEFYGPRIDERPFWHEPGSNLALRDQSGPLKSKNKRMKNGQKVPSGGQNLAVGHMLH